MKRFLPYLFLIFSLLCVLAVIFWCFTCAADYRALCDDPSASGIDYLGVGFLYGLGFAFCGVPGLVFSGLCRAFADKKHFRILSYVLTVFFILCLITFPILWFFGPGHP